MGIVYAIHLFGTVIQAWLPEWLHWLDWLPWPLFGIIVFGAVFFGFSLVANLIAAPFNGRLPIHCIMTTLVQTFFAFLVSCFRSRAVLQIENTMLRHQLNVYGRRQAKPRLRPMDRFLWAWVSRIWPGGKGC